MLATAARGGRAGFGRALIPRRGLSALVDVVRGENSKVAVVTMQRAPVNSLNLDLIQELSENLKKLADEGQVEGVVLASNQKAFSAGLDLDYVAKPHEMDFPKFWAAFEELWYTLYTSPLSTVAAIEGPAPAGGSVLALSCDYRVVADSPKLRVGLNEVQLGMVPPRWLQALCAQTVGARNSEFLLQRGHLMGPEEALKYGFVDEVVPKEDVMARAFKFLEPLVVLPRQARFQTKLQQREAVATMAGPWSGKELFDSVTSQECETLISSLMSQLQANKNKKK